MSISAYRIESFVKQHLTCLSHEKKMPVLVVSKHMENALDFIVSIDRRTLPFMNDFCVDIDAYQIQKLAPANQLWLAQKNITVETLSWESINQCDAIAQDQILNLCQQVKAIPSVIIVSHNDDYGAHFCDIDTSLERLMTMQPKDDEACLGTYCRELTSCRVGCTSCRTHIDI
jgi:hypothetical protein